MNKIISLIIFSIPITCFSQKVFYDTLVYVNGANLNFQLYSGQGIPIVFLTGAGDTSSKWGDIPEIIHQITGTTVITYDRSGTGKSSYNEKRLSVANKYLEYAVEDLEKGLKNLGYNKEIIMVAHSYGGYLTTLFASRNPKKVKYIVRIDASLANSYDDEFIDRIEKDYTINKDEVEIGFYYLVASFRETMEFMKKIHFPKSIPVINIVATEKTHHFTNREWNLMQNAQLEFASQIDKMTQIYAEGSDHYIYLNNPALVIHAVVRAYVQSINDQQKKLEILNNALNNAIRMSAEH